MLIALLLAVAQASLAPAAAAQPDMRAPSEIVAAAPAADWRAIAPDDLLVMDLAPGAGGKARRVVIQLMPPPFSQGWIANIRTLARAHWWDGTSVNRVQDNYVAQWGDATEKKALPPALRRMTDSDYAFGDNPRENYCGHHVCPPANLKTSAVRLYSTPFSQADTFFSGWPIGERGNQAWPIHCYATVGVGRDMSPDTGSGAELYAVIGHAPRHLDRNIAVVGRVIEGIEHLSGLPRGTEALGFYATPAERTPIMQVRLVSDLAAADRPRFEYLSTDSATFARYADMRANRRDPFFKVPAGGVDICNVPVPVRRVR